MSTPRLPEHLHDAYEWTEAAGELDELRDLSGADLAAYCDEAEANCRENGDSSVTADDLHALHAWLAEVAS